ncbi:hypothetical protein TNCV_2583851 [Trichonephila clavipes]|nr:hypothetical protein TNCV_2583851 [Trichonephila clavipes]
MVSENNNFGCSADQSAPFSESMCDMEIKSIVNIGQKIQTVLYNQEENFLKTLPRTCFSSYDIPNTYVNQIWKAQPDYFQPQTNFQSIDMKSEWCDRFCFPADIFLPPEASSSDSIEFSSCSGNQFSGHEHIPVTGFVEFQARVLFPLKTCHVEGLVHVKSVGAQSSHWRGVTVKRGERCQLMCRLRHLTVVSKLRALSPVALGVLYNSSIMFIMFFLH